MPSHSIAKSAVKPVFSPLPHPSFFAPKSPFFALFSVSNPISGDFSRDSARFLPCEAHFFSSFLVLTLNSGDFSRNISRFYLRLPHFQFMLPPSSLPPPLSFSFLPTFPSPSPINAQTRAHSRITCVRVRSHLLARQEVFVYCLHRFTTHHNSLCTNALGVKENEKKPSQKTQSPHNQHINTKHPISSTVNFI